MIIPLYIPGHWELVLVVIALLILFGGRKIPEMMKGIGTGIKEFKKGVRDDDGEKKSIADEGGSEETEKK
ncbi:MAG: Sec-independent protein translocase protein TatA [Calditrichaeota bacterium]|nr:Sec-independent protein translocase protein TatA [Calditrichota bacterium]